LFGGGHPRQEKGRREWRRRHKVGRAGVQRRLLP
jgi:hypothetical protein